MTKKGDRRPFPGAIVAYPYRRSQDRIIIDPAGLLNGIARKVPFAREVSHLAVI